MILQVWSALEGQLEGKLELMLAVRSPTWSSEGYVGVQIGSDCAASADCTGLSGAQEASKTLQELPKTLQVSLQRRPKRGPRATKQQSERNSTANSATLQKPWFS